MNVYIKFHLSVLQRPRERKVDYDNVEIQGHFICFGRIEHFRMQRLGSSLIPICVFSSATRWPPPCSHRPEFRADLTIYVLGPLQLVCVRPPALGCQRAALPAWGYENNNFAITPRSGSDAARDPASSTGIDIVKIREPRF